MSNPIIEKRSEASIISIQQNVTDHRAVTKELQEARERIHDQMLEINKLKHQVAKQNNDLAVKEAEKHKLQLALDAVVKELSATKALVGDVQSYNDRLRRDLGERGGGGGGNKNTSASSASGGFLGNNTKTNINASSSSINASQHFLYSPSRNTTASNNGNNSSASYFTKPESTPSGMSRAILSVAAAANDNNNSPLTPSRPTTGSAAASAPRGGLAVTRGSSACANQEEGANANTNIPISRGNSPLKSNDDAAANNNPNTNSDTNNSTMMAMDNRQTSNSNSSAPLGIYLQKCLDCDVSPHALVVKSFYKNDGVLVAGDFHDPISYLQLLMLVETLSQRKFASVLDLPFWGNLIRRLEIVVESSSAVLGVGGETAKTLVAPLIEVCSPSLTSLLVASVDDRIAASVAGAIAISQQLANLELPLLAVGDKGLQAIMKVVVNRDVAANNATSAAVMALLGGGASNPSSSSPSASSPENSVGNSSGKYNGYTADEITYGAVSAQTKASLSLSASATAHHLVGAPIVIDNLDLSETNALSESDTFFLIKGTFIRSISFKNCTQLLDKHLGEVILSSPNLESLDLTSCASLTQDCLLFINQSKKLRHLTLVNCPAIHTLRFTNNITSLSADFRGVTHFSAPLLERFTTPLYSFSCVTFECNKLADITIANTTLSAREFVLLSECTALTSAQFINCRCVATTTSSVAAAVSLSQEGISTSSATSNTVAAGGGFQLFLRRMRRLSKLSVRCCKGITDADIECLGSTIEDLDLTECYCLTDKIAQKIGAVCKNLKRLTLKRCSGISDIGLFFLSQCPSLEFLNILGMRKVTKEGIKRLCQQFAATTNSLCHIIHETFVPTTVPIPSLTSPSNRGGSASSSSPSAATEGGVDQRFVGLSLHIRVDRTDDEESQREQNANEERSVVHRRHFLALQYDSKSPVMTILSQSQQQQQQHGEGETISSAHTHTHSNSRSPIRGDEERFNGWSTNIRRDDSNDNNSPSQHAAAVAVADGSSSEEKKEGQKPEENAAVTSGGGVAAADEDAASNPYDNSAEQFDTYESPTTTSADVPK